MATETLQLDVGLYSAFFQMPGHAHHDFVHYAAEAVEFINHGVAAGISTAGRVSAEVLAAGVTEELAHAVVHKLTHTCGTP